MSFPTYVTVPSERTILSPCRPRPPRLALGGFASSRPSLSSSIRITQQPCELALGLQIHGAGFLQVLECMGPEMQAQDVPFPRQQVIADVHPGHRSKMAADDVIGDEAGHFGGGVAALLDVMERGGPDLQPLLVRLIPLGDARVQVPAVVVEPRRSGDAAAHRPASCARARESRRRRPQPGRRCRQCSSGSRRRAPETASAGRTRRRARRCAGDRCAPPCSD